MISKADEEDEFGCDISICKSICCRSCAVLTGQEVMELIRNVRSEYGFEIELTKYFRQVRGERGTYFAVRIIKGQCIFLNKENRCRIYRCRPKLCVLYPVIDVNELDERCPLANILSKDVIEDLKLRYREEINERIKAEKTFIYE